MTTTAAQLSAEELDAIDDMLVAARPARKFHPFVQNEPRATRAQTDALRAALAAHPDEALVRLVRGYFNALRANYRKIQAIEVRAALALLARR